jgi:hypothetical protein
VLSQAQPTITVSKPFILTTLAMAGNTSDTVAVTSATVVNGSLHFTNTLPDQLGDVSVQINISGSALDRQSVRSDSNGFYHSENGAINWDKNSNNDFALIDPGDSRDLSFSFSSLKLGITDKNPEVDVTTIINGSRTSPVGAVEKISTTITKTVKILANLVLISKSLRGGPIPNTGPFPPKAENVSTYTIDWALTNMWNDVSGAKVTTTLPPYVEWTGVVNPQTANITYDSASHTVTWSPDSVSAGAGFTQSPKEVFFQVKIHPSLSQVQATPAITSDLVLSAKDNFTDSTIKLTNNPLTTQAFDLNDNGFVTK